jgi:hypothetical protein
MDEGTILIYGIIIVVGLAMGSVLFASIINNMQVESSSTATVANIEYSAGGFGHTDITSVYLDNGTVYPINGRHSFTIGATYTFYLSKSGTVIDWERIN